MKKSDWNIFLQALGRYAKRDVWLLPVVIATNILKAVQPFLTILLSSALLDWILEGRKMEELLRIALGGLGAIWAVSLLYEYLTQKRSEKWLHAWDTLDQCMVEKSLRIDYAFLDDSDAQFLLRKQEEYSYLRGNLYNRLFSIVEAFSYGVTTLIIAFVLAAKLLFIRADGVAFVTALVAVTFLTKRLADRKLAKRQNEITDEWLLFSRASSFYYNNFLDGYENGKDIRIFGQKRLIQKEISDTMRQMERLTQILFRLGFGYDCVTQGIAAATGCLIYLFAGFWAYAGAVSLGNAAKYVNSISRFSKAFMDLVEVLGDIRELGPYMRDFEAYQNLEKGRLAGTIPVEKRRDNKFLLEFRNVSFRYPNASEYALKNINLKMEVGERMAVVGRNGSGKSTFIKLLCRLYDPTEGEIRLNGIDIRKYDEAEYLAILSVVFQDYHIFDLKVGENLAASRTVDEARAKDAMERAGLSGFWKKLPEGIHTYVGKSFSPGGIEVSGGERQKLAIARAIYHSAPFVIMDEPTAALDPVAEYEVYAGFDKMVGSRTAIYISHRLASCRFCNDILVFEEGRVVQRGSHANLIAQDGLYAQLWNAQAQYYR
ncbi:MAG: ABC transporter ATP-binding protein [Eubacteriales bacterium]|nr:ABC transporter ATP-binding protein [Eubacteriales bacterium]